MLSHLRFHRRAPSNPPSPLPDQSPSWETAALHEHPQTVQDVSPRPETRPRSANSSQMPPTLPPIARVASADPDLSPPLRDSFRDDIRPVSQGSRFSPTQTPYDSGNTGFIGGVALQNYRRNTQGAQRPESTGNQPMQLPESHISRAKPPPPPINTGFVAARPALAANNRPSKSTSFVAPTDLQQSYVGAAGKRPSGTRLASEPATTAAPTPGPETQKGKKGLPFLKNPMSTLLMRRRTGQNAPDVQPLPVPAEPSYDPRIRGTRVHDFSAPRPKRVTSSTDAVASSFIKPDPTRDSDRRPAVPERSEPNGLAQHPPFDPNTKPTPEPTLDRKESFAKSSDGSYGSTVQDVVSLGGERRPVEQPVPPVPPKDASSSIRSPSSATSRPTSTAPSARLHSSASARTNKSRFSASGVSTRDSVLSSVPKHMKSTSSRFSFDMIGSANQEKILEERHRQREQDKKTTDVVTGQRDSRFDEFDDDAFDYDAMMDDDGLEERIPGVNADLEEEEEEEDYFEEEADPDNDQENFAGFVFQRSNPASSLASPHSPGMLATPRDSNGKVIGFAMTKDTTPELPSSTSPIFFHEHPVAPGKQDDSAVSGLGILGPSDAAQSVPNGELFRPSYQISPADSQPAAKTRPDDLYFDDGLADELAFVHDGTVFDESIFDINDTDKYGRPIPGAFAQAQEAMRSAQQNHKRDSDVDSGLPRQSGVSESTAHTSMTVGPRNLPTATEVQELSLSPKQIPDEPEPAASVQGQDLIYQAALAEAAQKAAASGKFRRSSSPPLPAQLTITSPTDSSESLRHSNPDDSLDNYEDDPFANDFDDYELDDEAIIAEANADALASDADGFYGQEFGFYSAPAPQPHHGQTHHGSAPSGPPAALSAENLYQYANGGYFGPAGQGVNRSTSGRVVSREPNLTPITERSEYSNRNSIMSLALPPAIGSDGGRNSVGMQSPGLAQLALMSDDDNMSLSALLKLRSKAWGGSQVSLPNSREGSPRSDFGGGAAPGDSASPPPYGSGSGILGPPANIISGTGHTRKNSAFSIWTNSDAGSGPGSPTLTMNMTLPMSSPAAVPPVPPVPTNIGGVASPQLQSMFSPPLNMSSPGQQPGGNPCSPVFEDEEADAEEDQGLPPLSPRPMSASGAFAQSPTQMGRSGTDENASESPTQQHHRRPSIQGHRHKGSADSISYIKEEETTGGTTRWVMERRRTAETGEVEILEREIVEGGRI
ncbi:hypothetical protein B0T24DRAFT_627422 [Lasiosphaeria ovina]|uniref:AGC-kinase C-terminal domain-containing protein n=1 Tax=Lasiosphaeria ovina TaxID=92902 RepID=A0AAE0N5H8_9PEZI|nr:hypothetical protein B0T24DRAFT_627422 [Lasiosphaeria ovina]